MCGLLRLWMENGFYNLGYRPSITEMKKKMVDMRLDTTAPKIVITGFKKDGTPGTDYV
jgi:hypothetical protein